MKKRTALTTASALAALGAGAVVLPAVASASSATHTLKFTAVVQKQKNISKTQFAQDEKDVNSKGKIIGFDTVWGTFNPATNAAHGYVAVSLKGGQIYGRMKFTNGATITGTVVGGVGKFKGATGTITATQLNSSGTRNAVTITYHT